MAEKKDNGEKKSKGGEEGKKKDEKKSGPSTVVLKIDMHCEGCASKIIKCAKAFEGVEKAKVEWEASKLTVEGKVDPTKLRESLQEKTKKKVELVSPQPKKDKENKGDNATNSNKDSGKGQEKKKADEEKKPKEPPVTTAVLKLGLHCQGCVQKIQKFVSKTSGVKNVTIERQKDLVTVTGTMDAKTLAEGLKRRMKREVEIVPQKKEKEKGKDNQEKKEGNEGGNGGNAGSEKKGGGDGDSGGNGGGGGGNSNGNGNGGKKKKGGGSGGGGGGGGGGSGGGGGGGDGSNAGGNKEGESGNGIMEGNRMEYSGIVGFPANTGYGYGYGYGHGGYTYGENVHAPQYFSDENPNACSVM